MSRWDGMGWDGRDCRKWNEREGKEMGWDFREGIGMTGRDKEVNEVNERNNTEGR